MVFLCLPGDPADTDYTAVGCAITTISSNLTEMSKGVKLLAALMDDEVGSGEDLLRAARTLAGAVSDLLKAVQPTSGEPRQTVLTAAGSIGQASGDLLRQIGENETDERFQVRHLQPKSLDERSLSDGLNPNRENAKKTRSSLSCHE